MNHTAPWSGNPSFPRECARAGGNFRNRSIVWHCVKPELNGWQRAIFDLLRIDPARFHLVTKPLRVRALLVPEAGMVIRGGMSRLHGTALGVRPIGPGQGRRIWLSRSQLTDDRALVCNEAELEAILERRGWQVIHPQTLSVTEQIDALNGASVICGLEGSALRANNGETSTPRKFTLEGVR